MTKLVKVLGWDELVDEFGVDKKGDIKISRVWSWNHFNDSKLPLSRVVSIDDGLHFTNVEANIWKLFPGMFIPFNPWEDEHCLLCDNRKEAKNLSHKTGGQILEVPPKEEEDILWDNFVFIHDLEQAQDLCEMEDQDFRLWLDNDFQIID